jgi:hypothetical protein
MTDKREGVANKRLPPHCVHEYYFSWAGKCQGCRLTPLSLRICQIPGSAVCHVSSEGAGEGGRGFYGYERAPRPVSLCSTYNTRSMIPLC